MTGCEMIKCGFYKDGKCTDPVEYVDRETGDQVCRHRPEAIPKADFADINLREAAREMYEACKMMLGALCKLAGGLPDSTFTEPYFAMRNAVAKAEGRPAD